MESTATRTIVWIGVMLLAATVTACGGATQAITGTAPSQISLAAANDNGGSFALLKEGKGKGRPVPDIGTPPTTETTPEADDPEAEADAPESGHGHGHGKAAIQIEGFTSSIDGDCTAGLTIVMKDAIPTTVKTDDLTDFQRATCGALAESSAPSIHLHIAARKLEDDSLVAIYVRMQGPKFDEGEGAEEEETTEPTN